MLLRLLSLNLLLWVTLAAFVVAVPVAPQSAFAQDAEEDLDFDDLDFDLDDEDFDFDDFEDEDETDGDDEADAGPSTTPADDGTSTADAVPQDSSLDDPSYLLPSDTEEILITGQKRGASQQTNAIAITSFSQTDLDELGVQNVETLQTQRSVALRRPDRHGGRSSRCAESAIENLTTTGEAGVPVLSSMACPTAVPAAANSLFFDVQDVSTCGVVPRGRRAVAPVVGRSHQRSESQKPVFRVLRERATTSTAATTSTSGGRS